MKILIARTAGFCFGVKRAVDMVFDVAEKKSKGVYTLGPLIHNPQVIDRLKGEGVEPVEKVSDLSRKKVDTVVVRTHGIPQGDMDTLSSKGFNVIDATCPFVKKAQHYAKLLKDEGYKVVILGDKEHPEVKGIMSYAGKDAVVVRGAEELGELRGKVGIIVQTTKQIDTLKELVSAAIEKTKELKVYNTICNSTALRMRETADMAKKVDLMMIVGGKNSANTTRLANHCKSLGVRTRHIETADEIRKSWFKGMKTVGITAGASTPDWIIEEVKDRINKIV